MAKITIGGQNVEVPKLNFRQLKRAWPYIVNAAKVEEENALDALDAILWVVAIGVVPTRDGNGPKKKEVLDAEVTAKFEEFEDALDLECDRENLQTGFRGIMSECGLVTKKGEPPISSAEGKGNQAENSTETSTQ